MDIEGILAITFIFGGGSMFLLAISPIGKAIAQRISGRGTDEASWEELQGLQESHDALVEEVETMRGEFADLQERMDFTERLFARQNEPAKLDNPDVQD